MNGQLRYSNTFRKVCGLSRFADYRGVNLWFSLNLNMHAFNIMDLLLRDRFPERELFKRNLFKFASDMCQGGLSKFKASVQNYGNLSVYWT